MTVEEIKAKHQPRQLENQVEFEAIMSDINQQQGELNRPLIDRGDESVTFTYADGRTETERFADIVEQARLYILTDCGGSFEKFAEWGLIRPQH